MTRHMSSLWDDDEVRGDETVTLRAEREREERERVERDARDEREDEAHRTFGGTNWGSCFFGWLVAVGVAILLIGIVGAVGAAIGVSADMIWSDAQPAVGSFGLAAAAVLLVVLLIGYYEGGYVAGRMARFDGARQGVGVWFIGLVVTVAAGVLGAVFGRQYDVLDRVDLPRIPLSLDQVDQMDWVVLATAVVVILGTLLAAMAGAKVGHRYHHKVDQYAGA